MDKKYLRITAGDTSLVAGMEDQTSVRFRLNLDTANDKIVAAIDAYKSDDNAILKHHEWNLGNIDENRSIAIEIIKPENPTPPTKIDKCHGELSRDEKIFMQDSISNIQEKTKEIERYIQESEKSSNAENDNLMYCSFCGKNQNEVHKLISGPEIFICDECVNLCVDILVEDLEPMPDES